MRACFYNPNYFCSFNSLTQCLYNLDLFRKFVLSFNPGANVPPILADDTIREAELPEKVARQYRHFERSIQFTRDYTEIMKQMHEKGKRLDLTKCVENLEDAAGVAMLRQGPADPQLEFIAILQMFAIADAAFLCPQLQPWNNEVMRMFEFMTSRSFEKPSRQMFLTLSDDSSIFHIKVAGHFHDFRERVGETERVVLHSLPDLLCVHFRGVGDLAERKLQLTVDFTHYVFDNSKSYKYQINSLVMLLNETHASAYVRVMATAGTRRERWLICDDVQQREVDLDALHQDLAHYGASKRACVAFYERVP